jgi:hypothetical protein
MKIDVERHEHAVLEGSQKNYLTSPIVVVYIETSHEGEAPEKGATRSGFFY